MLTEESEMIPQVKLSRWKPHLQAAARQGKTLAKYAREHGLSRYTLYAARQMRVPPASLHEFDR